jgi:hypothetical protein
MIIFARMKDKSTLRYEVCDACSKPIGQQVKKGDIKYIIIKKASEGIKACADCLRKKEKKIGNK